jgi:hypothetical protein
MTNKLLIIITFLSLSSYSHDIKSIQNKFPFDRAHPSQYTTLWLDNINDNKISLKYWIYDRKTKQEHTGIITTTGKPTTWHKRFYYKPKTTKIIDISNFPKTLDYNLFSYIISSCLEFGPEDTW